MNFPKDQKLFSVWNATAFKNPENFLKRLEHLALIGDLTFYPSKTSTSVETIKQYNQILVFQMSNWNRMGKRCEFLDINPHSDSIFVIRESCFHRQPGCRQDIGHH